MNEVTVYWKCLAPGRLSAICAPSLWGLSSASLAAIHYPKHQWVTPHIPGSKLFVFNHRPSALRFASSSSLITVPCLVKSPKKVKLSGRLSFDTTDEVTQFKMFWNQSTEAPTFQVPEGTFICDAVRCLE